MAPERTRRNDDPQHKLNITARGSYFVMVRETEPDQEMTGTHTLPCLPFHSSMPYMPPSSKRLFLAISIQQYNSKEGPLVAADVARLKPLRNASADAASMETLFRHLGYRSSGTKLEGQTSGEWRER